MQKVYELKQNELEKIFEQNTLSGIVLLQGDLAMGKTTLVKALAKYKNIQDDISSPTFSVMQGYGDFYHYDIYNSKLQGFLASGLHENLGKKGLHLIEWAEEDFEDMLKSFGFSYTRIKIEKSADKNKRIYKVSFHA